MNASTHRCPCGVVLFRAEAQCCSKECRLRYNPPTPPVRTASGNRATRVLRYMLALGSNGGITDAEAMRRWGGDARRLRGDRATIEGAGVHCWQGPTGVWYANVEDAM